MKKELFLIMILLAIPLSSSLKIIEVELNPEDDCYDCTEWAELYSKVEINLSEYWLENSKTKIINLSGIKKDYIKIEFGKRFLTNTGDILILKKYGEIIDETPLLNDEENNNFTWQLCDSWEFLESTKGEKNNCVDETDDEEPSPEETEIIEETEEETENNEDENTYESEKPEPEISPLTNSKETENFASEEIEKRKPEIIRLNPQVIKTQSDKENSDNKTLRSIILNKNKATYGFIVFCVLLGFLYIIKLKKTCKNEFE